MSTDNEQETGLELPVRKVLIYNTALNTPTNTIAIDSKAQTFGELKKDFELNDIPFNANKMGVTIGETKHSLELDEAMLPTHMNYTIFMMPLKNKSGMATSITKIIQTKSKPELIESIKRLYESKKFSIKAKAVFTGYSRTKASDLRAKCILFCKNNRGSSAFFRDAIEVGSKVPAKKPTASSTKKASVKLKKTPEFINKFKDLISSCDEPSVKIKLKMALMDYYIVKNKPLTDAMSLSLKEQASLIASNIPRYKKQY